MALKEGRMARRQMRRRKAVARRELLTKRDLTIRGRRKIILRRKRKGKSN